MQFQPGELKKLDVALKPIIVGPGGKWTDLGVVASESIYTVGVPLYDGVVIAGCWYGRAYRSANYGGSWQSLGIFSDINTAIAYLGNGIIIMADVSHNIYRSTDQGVTWTQTQVGTHPFECGCSLGNGIVVLGTDDGNVYRSTDYGATWRSVRSVDGYAVLSMAYLGNGVAMLTSNNHYVYLSTDYGASWTRRYSVYIVHAMATMDEGMVILINFKGQAFTSMDYGTTWSFVATLPYNQIRAVAYLGNGVVIAGGHTWVYRSSDYGVTWQKVLTTVGFVETMAYLGNKISIIADNQGHVYRST